MKYALAALLLLSACTQSGELSGEVYLVLQNRDTVKMSGSFVYLAPMNAANLTKVAEFEKTRDLSTIRDLDILQTATTDADGRFTITAPRGRYFVTVTEARGVIGKQEFVHWLVIADVPGTISLNNSNMHNLTP